MLQHNAIKRKCVPVFFLICDILRHLLEMVNELSDRGEAESPPSLPNGVQLQKPEIVQRCTVHVFNSGIGKIGN